MSTNNGPTPNGPKARTFRNSDCTENGVSVTVNASAPFCVGTEGYAITISSLCASIECDDTNLFGSVTADGKTTSMGIYNTRQPCGSIIGGMSDINLGKKSIGSQILINGKVQGFGYVDGASRVPISASDSRSFTIEKCPCCDSYGEYFDIDTPLSDGGANPCPAGKIPVSQGSFSCPEGSRQCYKCEDEVVDCGVCFESSRPCACCPDEDGQNCGSDCCCCPRYEEPIRSENGSCICVPAP